MERVYQLFKCRLCGELFRGAAVPEGFPLAFYADIPRTLLHNCAESRDDLERCQGIGDLVGFEPVLCNPNPGGIYGEDT